MTELELIAELTKNLPSNNLVVEGPGDDCAVIANGPSYLLLKTDAVVEGIHFEKSADPRKVGRKALARALSDIAAMSGLPECALVTIGLPSTQETEYIRGIYNGMAEIAQRYSVAIVGGEIVKNPERLFISIALTGKVEKDRCVLRKGSQKGDGIFVTGELGGSISGKHMDFEPRILEARWLTEHFKPTAMIDLSDGIASDLKHILNASGVGAELLGTAVPVSRAAKLNARAESSAKPALLAALTDGEDFELLFTIKSADAVPLLDAWKKEFPQTKLSCIGRITEGTQLLLRDTTGTHELKGHGYMHFQ